MTSSTPTNPPDTTKTTQTSPTDSSTTTIHNTPPPDTGNKNKPFQNYYSFKKFVKLISGNSTNPNHYFLKKPMV